MSADKEAKKRVQELLSAAEQRADAELPSLVVSLLLSFDDPHPWVRRASLDALGRMAEFRGFVIAHDVAARVARMANDPDEGVRAETAVALALIVKDGRQSEAERLTLHRLLEDPSAKVRREAAAALGDVGDTSVIGKLFARADSDDDDEVKFEAAFALATMKDARGLPVLAAALDQPKKRLDACEGLRRLGNREALPALEKLASKLFLEWPDRLTVLATMHALGDDAAGNGVLERTQARNREERAYALSLIGSHRIPQGARALIDVAANEKDRLRDTAVRALGDLGDSSALEVLGRIAGDAGAPSELRADARASIERIGGGKR